MKLSVLYFLASVWFSIVGYAQVPTASFSIPPSGCLQQRIPTTNTSTNANSYEWDFCADDFQTLKSNLSIATLSGLSGGFGYKLVEDNGNWYGFVVSQTGSPKLFRINFGDSPLNLPLQTVDLGNPDASLAFPQDVEIYKANGKWYGFVGFNDPGYGLVRLDFGSSLTNIPSATNIGNFGVSGRFWDIKIVEQNSNLVLVLNERNTGSLVRVNYRNSFENAIVNATHVFVTNSITSSNLSPGFDLVQNNGNWIALLTSYFDNKLYQVNFGNDIFSSPTLQSSFSLATFNRPMRVRIVQEGNRYVGVVSNESSAISIVDLKDLNPVNAPTLISQIGLPNFLGLDVERYNGKSFILGVGGLDNRVRQLIFESDCGVAPSFLSTQSPTINYSTSGTKVIELKAINSTTRESALSARTITVSTAAAPDIDFTITNSCVNAPVNFTPINSTGDITSYSWNFGDGNVATTSNPQNTYSVIANYPISLQVTSSNGCINSNAKSHTIYNPPQANFTLPAASSFCTNQQYQFANISTFDAGTSPTWQWSINGSSVSTAKDLTTTFSATTSQQILLVASIPGCNTQSIQSINSLTAGPLVNFTMSNGCQAAPVLFTNTTSGAVTSYSWAFGDGNNSTLTSPQNTFTNIGTYQITLQANNAAGCQNSVSKSITIYSKPQPNFSLALPPFSCAGTASQFTDSSPNPTDSNLTSWSWNFGDPNNSASLQRNPNFVYSTASNFLVTLTVGTNFGCSNSIQKSVTISPSPTASFTNAAACINQATQFTDTSTGSIQSRLWQIQGNNFSAPNPQVTFLSSGSFPALLVVTATNGCINQTSRNIVVSAQPSLDFSVAAPCINNQTTFTELTNAVDPSVSQSWVFGSVANGVGSPTSFSFSATGTYAVKLNSTRQSGCIFSVTKNVSISTSPIASFTPSVESGAAPLEVTFANNSTASTSYTWKFGDANASTSMLTNPTITYTTLGDYVAELTAFNLLGCSSIFSAPIRVVVPMIDLALTDFYFMKDQVTGALQPVVTVANKSNVTISDPYIYLDVAGNAGVKKRLTGAIKPLQELTQVLDFQLVPQSINYACAEVEAVGDVDTFFNRKCISLSNQEIIFAPFPNPVKDVLNMDWISIDESPVSIDVIGTHGSILFQQTITTVKKGINRIAINVESLPAGIYFVRFTDARVAKSFGFAVSKN